MKIAIVCDWLVTIGGAEKFLSEVLACYPQADLFSVIDFLSADERTILQNKKAITTFIQKLPFAKTKYRHYLPLMPLAIEQLDLSKYDLILSFSHAVAKGVITGPDQIHISYVYSPMRYAWDLQHQYLQETGLNKKWYGILARYFLHKLRIWDLRSASNVDHFIATSKFIAKRIQKTYRRSADVIYPPVDLARFSPGTSKEDFYLTACRLVPYKRIDLIVESFGLMPDKKLIVIGDGPEFEKIKSRAKSNITLLGYQSNTVLIDHLQKARAFITAAEEDFGLLPLEAHACGTPVIAYGKGGSLETIRGLQNENPTGIFFAEQNATSICEAVLEFEKHYENFTIENCVAQAAKFNQEDFRKMFVDFVDGKIRNGSCG